MKVVCCLVLMAAVITASCAGVKFAPASVNEDIPDAFTQRALYPSGVAGYAFNDLVGNIINVVPGEDPMRIGVIIPADYEDAIIPITDSNNYYRSRIQAGAESQCAFLAFAANFSEEKMVELTLIDIARAGIIMDQKVWDEIYPIIENWVREHPKKNPDSKRLWIKASVLSRRIYITHTKIDADASEQVGDVTGVKTGVYRKAEEGNKSVIISFEASDIDILVREATRQQFRPVTMHELLKISKCTDIINGTIYK